MLLCHWKAVKLDVVVCSSGFACNASLGGWQGSIPPLFSRKPLPLGMRGGGKKKKKKNRWIFCSQFRADQLICRCLVPHGRAS